MKKLFIIFILTFTLFLTGCDKLLGKNTIKNLKFEKSNGIIVTNFEANNLKNMYIQIIKTKEDVNLVLNNYPEKFRNPITETINKITNKNDNYFIKKRLIVIPFIHTVEEKEIELKKIYFDIEDIEMDIYFDLFSPEVLTTNLNVNFFVAELDNKQIENIKITSFKQDIEVYNKRNKTTKSFFYD